MKWMLFILAWCSSCSTLVHSRKPSSTLPISNLTELKEQLSVAQEGDVLSVSSLASFDLTAESTIEINKSITIQAASTQSEPEQPTRPHFFSHSKPLPLFKITAQNVVIDGLWLEGDEKDSKKTEIIELNKKGIKGVYQFPVTRGFDVSSQGVVIRNCEIEGFSHAAIFVIQNGSVLVENNKIHHNQRWGLGYGVALHENSSAEIRGNNFDWNRHSIAGSGFAKQSYEAHHNIFGPNHNDTPLDMHGGKDRGDGTQIAGNKVEIHHNKIEDCGWPIFIHRGIAEDKVVIRDNDIHYADPDRVIGYYNGVTKANLPAGKFIFERNVFP